MDRIKKYIAEAREIEAKATPGPCEKELSEDGYWRIHFPNKPRGFGGGCYGFKMLCDERDAELYVHARNNHARLLDALEEAKGTLEKHGHYWVLDRIAAILEGEK